ncbi:MAG: right-handed parallel beta-helix repeat-containing protein [Phycisphaerae bacterium]|nr:right-handed parallel beta-helix repeat-containing protein [Phycisphaerae bacterium]
MKAFVTLLSIITVVFGAGGCAGEYHVSPAGDDGNPGTMSRPFKSISAAAKIAMPGDVVTVHEGIYRERVNPVRGGSSETKRIVYQAAQGEKVLVKGSEVVKGWTKVENDTWKIVLPNSFFGDFNPFNDLIRGDWYRNNKGASNHTGAVYLNGEWLGETFTLEDVTKPAGEIAVWFAEVDDKNTTILAQFKGVDPNAEMVEVNVRQAVFYPDKPGVNYITVRGFTMEHAATPWAPPTAEQIGLIGTHWSKGWVIEDNRIRHSVCTGITLGKHGDEFDNTSQNSAVGYVETIKRALQHGWSKKNIGHHVVRNNHISHCGQAGIVGSMGAAFSTVSGNLIHDIHMGRSFGGAEMAGIKFHAPIDTLISGNHVYRCDGRAGIWLDWMTQGTRVTGNLLHDNLEEDLFVEVNHGPFIVDNNIMLSETVLLEACGGGAYVNNLFAGGTKLRGETSRKTPYHPPHSTRIAGLSKVVGDDERFCNNLFAGGTGLAVYDAWKPDNLYAAGNVYLAGAKPSVKDRDALVAEDFDPSIKLYEKDDGWYLKMSVDGAWGSKIKHAFVTTQTLPKAIVSGLPYLQVDGKPYRIDTDYFNNKRITNNPLPGPFEVHNGGKINIKVWPKGTN